jgi:2-polyprenyl-6-methoxyphenol hydroxylase-like FAD-dependent oxidoreductase
MIIGSTERYGYPALRVHRDKLRHALLEAAEESGVEVKYGRRCLGIESGTSSYVTAKFANGETVKADLIVGADSVNSKIRPHIHPDVTSEYTGGMFIAGSLDRKHMRTFELSLPCVVPGPVGQFALVPADREGEVVNFFAWISGQERTREHKGELRKMIRP